jgi:hypothetical protein
VSDPARGAQRRPQARPAGSLTPRMLMSPRGPACHEKAARFVMKNWSQIVTRSESASGHDFVLMSAPRTCIATAASLTPGTSATTRLTSSRAGLAGVPVMLMNGKHPSDATRRLFKVD